MFEDRGRKVGLANQNPASQWRRTKALPGEASVPPGNHFTITVDLVRGMLILALAALAMRWVVRRLHRTIPPTPAAIRISAAASGRSSIGDHGNRFIPHTVKLLGIAEHWISPLLTYRVGGNPSSALRVRWAHRPPLVASVKVTSSEFSTRCSCCR